MRYSNSQAIAELRDAFAAAESHANDVFDEVGMERDSARFILAQDAEHDALSALFNHPAENAGDVLVKLRLYMDREIHGWDGERARGANKTCIAAIENDLRNLNRPCVSRAMADAFDKWARAALAFAASKEGDDEQERIAETEASEALYALPCATPGDYIAKHFVDQLSEDGGYNGGFPFLINNWSDDSFFTDIAGCDLGRCMMALGTTDFDAGLWIKQMHAIGAVFHIDGNNALYVADSLPETSPKCDMILHNLLLQLIGGDFADERRSAVVGQIAQPMGEAA